MSVSSVLSWIPIWLEGILCVPYVLLDSVVVTRVSWDCVERVSTITLWVLLLIH